MERTILQSFRRLVRRMRKSSDGIFKVRLREIHVERDHLQELVQLGNTIFIMPNFLQEFGKNDSANPLLHEYEGSFLRHLAIEKVLVKLRDWLYDNDALPGYTLIQAFLSIPFGLNCNFALRDIALYVVWYLRGCKPCHVWDNQMKFCCVCSLPVEEKDKEFSEGQQHPGILGDVHPKCYEKACEEEPDLPWKDPISSEVDYQAMGEALGIWPATEEDLWHEEEAWTP